MEKSIEDWICEYMLYCRSKKLRPKTMCSFEQTLHLFKRWLEETEKLTDIGKVTEAIIRRYIVDLQQRGKYTTCVSDFSKAQNRPERRRDYRTQISDVTINNYIRNIRAFFNWLDFEAALSKNPMKKIRQIKTERRAKEYLTDEEFYKLCKSLDLSYFAEHRDHTIINLLLDTGMRLGECLSLKIDDLDTAHRAIRLKEENTKGRHSRNVFFSKKMDVLLRKWLRYKDRYCESVYLFPKHDGTQINISSFEANFRKYLRRSGISKEISPHALRNNFAKRCLMAGMDIYTLSRILGHSSVTVTEKAYLDLTDDDIRLRYQHFSPIENMR
ncbi:MAG: tyrosine-type recombinase/integrase [Clostridiales bacterium]|nr:tyrosine-type recombinase/integrase [Clostridiales bacterium]